MDNSNGSKKNYHQTGSSTSKKVVQIQEPTGKNIIISDTNLYLDNHKVISVLRNGGNLLVFPTTVVDELDSKKNDPRLGYEARETIKELDRLQEEGCEDVIEETGMIFSKMNLNPEKHDHQIIACLNYVLYHFEKKHPPYVGYDKVKFVTNDRGIKVAARRIKNKKNLVIEMYKKDRTEIKKEDLEIPTFQVDKTVVAGDWSKHFSFPANGLSKKVPDGTPFIGYSNKRNIKKGEFVAIRRGEKFEIINQKIECCGISPRMAKEATRPNWEQAAALYYVLNPDFDCVFLQGGAGSGKTLISMAAALSLKSQGLYKKIIIFRVPEPLDRKKTLGLLPGDAGAKIGLYLRPIAQALTKLINNNKAYLRLEREDLGDKIIEEKASQTKGRRKNSVANNGNGQGQSQSQQSKKASSLEVHVDEIFDRFGIEIAVLEYIRGENLDDAFIIVDDAQNLSLHEMKSMLTRVGENSKIVFTGDLNQIDSPYLDKDSAGLAHAIKKMGYDPGVAVVTMSQTLRSRIASLAERLL